MFVCKECLDRGEKRVGLWLDMVFHYKNAHKVFVQEASKIAAGCTEIPDGLGYNGTVKEIQDHLKNKVPNKVSDSNKKIVTEA
jgi:hypothetical protein